MKEPDARSWLENNRDRFPNGSVVSEIMEAYAQYYLDYYVDKINGEINNHVQELKGAKDWADDYLKRNKK